ncbi:MAG: N-acetyltransferase [Bacteroidetes bacterium]|nr:N-acetyltransferase [Bacteroidota bacterium]MCH8325553.1 N-acetyltransferase [Bacteroidota bacterium]
MEIINDKSNNVFISKVDGKEAYLRYVIRGEDLIDFIYTYTPPELRGKGLAEKIVKIGFEYAKKNNLKVIPTCPYIMYFLSRNEEFKSLLS